jgi:iron-sulfur cluster repair protein YtfE (RIC family)
MPRKKKAKIELPKPEESLFQISKFMKLIAGSTTILLTEKIASTVDRKIIWFLCEGKLTREQIASKSGIKNRTVSDFIDRCKNLGLLEEEKEKGGHPKRVIDYVQDEWKQTAREELSKKTKMPEQEPQTSQTT